MREQLGGGAELFLGRLEAALVPLIRSYQPRGKDGPTLDAPTEHVANLSKAVLAAYRARSAADAPALARARKDVAEQGDLRAGLGDDLVQARAGGAPGPHVLRRPVDRVGLRGVELLAPRPRGSEH